MPAYGIVRHHAIRGVLNSLFNGINVVFDGGFVVCETVLHRVTQDALDIFG
jgi:hypothetical protein